MTKRTYNYIFALSNAAPFCWCYRRFARRRLRQIYISAGALRGIIILQAIQALADNLTPHAATASSGLWPPALARLSLYVYRFKLVGCGCIYHAAVCSVSFRSE